MMSESSKIRIPITDVRMEKVSINKLPARIILWGGTGQAKVVRPIIEHFGSKVAAVFDDTPNLTPPFSDVDLYLGYEGFKSWIQRQPDRDIGFCLTIGNPHGRARLKLHELLLSEGLQPVSLAHPTAFIAGNAEIGPGAQIMAGAIICAEARIARQCIINTKASVDHECVLEDGVEIAPGATLCGLVHADVNAWVCAGATVLPRISIGADARVGAGAVVTKDVAPGAVVVGIPARPLVKENC
jgi:sugar O-acyltransferase (sialic acid O-acetyltransferase NeuD family)